MHHYTGSSLPGEHPGRPTPADAERWAAIYRDLIAAIEDAVLPLRAPGTILDVESYLAHVRRRLAFWDQHRGQ